MLSFLYTKKTSKGSDFSRKSREKNACRKKRAKSSGIKGGIIIEKNLSTEETASLKGAWFPEKNGSKERKKRLIPPPQQGKEKTFILKVVFDG